MTINQKDNTMNIDNMTYGELKSIAAMFANTTAATTTPFVIGQNYMLRTVTHYYTGRLAAIHGDLIVLEDAAWIADTGRWSDYLKNPARQGKEVEPYTNPVIVNIGALVDATAIDELPVVRK